MSEDGQQYRPLGGYGKMVNYLAECSRKSGALIQLATIVKEIRWSKGQVEVFDEAGRSYTARKAIITVPVGVWTAEENAKGTVQYAPSLPHKVQAAKQMGFGSVIKVLLQFKDAFWEDEAVEKKCNANTGNFHMAISDMPVPTWWSQLPNRSTLLTGWLSGPQATHMKNDDDEAILLKALLSVSGIFKIDVVSLREKLQWWRVFNWTADPFTRGSYSYSTLYTTNARSVLAEPVENTLFFAGEALYEGPEMGTVEAALNSGMKVSGRIMSGE
jgi:monoamine oxidase